MPKDLITSFIDFFYPPFRKLMPIQTFRYAACGGANTLLDIFVFFISYNFIYHRHILDLGFIAFQPYIAAFITAFCVSFPVGFLLMRHIVFTQSTLHGRVQLFRYFLLVAVCILLNYMFIKFFVEKLGFYPTIAKIITTIIVVSFSYLTQKHYTFKAKELKT
ncbi:MAG: GtrA family protein [Bacteroidetes bacterium]|nr:GtrA family protein [Bacteroidota bacterium]MBS1973307.1 GtrA family protein [Bacteroidota bacterium]